MSNLNKLLAYSICEEMEHNLFNDEECVATDIIGDIDDDEEDDSHILYDCDKSVKEATFGDILVLSAAVAALAGISAGAAKALVKAKNITLNTLFKKPSKNNISKPSSVQNQKSKKEFVDLTGEENRIIEKFTEKKIKNITSKYNKDPEIREKLFNSITKFLKEMDIDENDPEYADCFDKRKLIKLDVYEISYSVDCTYFCICDDDQYICVACSDIINMIGKELMKDKEISKYINWFDTGDGDEGCLYIQFDGDKVREDIKGGILK